jgi:hypothetical protein
VANATGRRRLIASWLNARELAFEQGSRSLCRGWAPAVPPRIGEGLDCRPAPLCPDRPTAAMKAAPSSRPDEKPAPTMGKATCAASPTIPSRPVTSRLGRYSASGVPKMTLCSIAKTTTLRERRGADLIQQMLEQMMIALIDDGHFDVGADQALHRCQTDETGADHDDVMGHEPCSTA